jgi:hypothetical protein
MTWMWMSLQLSGEAMRQIAKTMVSSTGLLLAFPGPAPVAGRSRQLRGPPPPPKAQHSLRLLCGNWDGLSRISSNRAGGVGPDPLARALLYCWDHPSGLTAMAQPQVAGPDPVRPHHA